MKRKLSICGLILACSVAPAFAQTGKSEPLSGPPPLGAAPPKPQTGVLLGPAPKDPSKKATDNCIEVEIDGLRSFDCTNAKLKEEVDKVAKVPNVPPLDARSQDISIGTFNQGAIQQQFGQNFGVSGVPQRPNASYPSPLAPRR